MALKPAIERARQLHSKALHHAVGVKVLGESWGLKESSSGLWSFAAALLHFGLLKDEGTGDKRKFQLTDVALRIIKDADPNSSKRSEAIGKAALAPVIHRELWEKYGDASNISDVLLKNYLTLDRADEGKAPFSDDAAEDLIKEYKDTISFAGLSKTATISEPDEEKASTPNGDNSLKIEDLAKVGDLVQVEIDGVLQLAKPTRVRAVQEHEGQTWVFVEGSETGIPMGQINVIERSAADSPKSPSIQPPTLPLTSTYRGTNEPSVTEREWLRGPLSKDTSYRLIVSGDLGPKEIGKLIKLLEAQQAVLSDDEETAN